MTTYDGTPVQPGDYVMRVPVKVEWDEEDPPFAYFGPATEPTRGEPIAWLTKAGATFERVAKPRPPLPTHLGAVVWVGPLPYFLARDGWFDADGHDALPDWLAEQDWTTTPPKGERDE